MNKRLLDRQIRSTCRDLLALNARTTGRAVRKALGERYGAAGKTERVFKIWREEAAAVAEAARPKLPTDIAELQRRMVAAEASAVENKARAELSILRERAHQDQWAMEIDKLRQEARATPQYVSENRALREKVRWLTVENQALRQMLIKAS